MKKHPNRSLFYFILLMIGFFFLMEMVFYIVEHAQIFLATSVVERHIKIPATLWLPMVGYWLLILLLHLIFAAIIFIITLFCADLFELNENNRWHLALYLTIASIIAVLLANRVLYPGSIFGILFSLPMGLSQFLLTICLAILLLASLAAILQITKTSTQKHPAAFCIIAAITIVFSGIGSFEHKRSVTPAQASRPNVIIIGLDAIRPDYLGPSTPTINHFLAKSTVFTHSITPLARTHAAWISILTGQLPKQNGVQFDLEHLSLQKIPETLSYILQRHGYNTIFSTDARAFNQITPRLGFNTVLGPPISADVYTVGMPSDLPLANLLVNTSLGKYLLPYSYNNRDAAITYNPKHYMQSVKHLLEKTKQRPIFLGIHLNLAHEPYSWDKRPYNQGLSKAENYRLAVKRVDQQLANLMQALQQYGYLKHAVVVLMSDHGEALALPGDRLISKAKYIKGPDSAKNTKQLFKSLIALETPTGALDTSIEHGTDILSMSQYNNMLGFRAFGMTAFNTHHIKDLVSLGDIKPTILALLHIKDHSSTLPSLTPYLYGKKAMSAPRFIFAETGMTPLALKKGNLSIANVVMQTADTFKIDPKNDSIILSPKSIQQLLENNKQRAVFYEQWVLASYPTGHRHIFLLVNRHTGQWTDDIHSAWAKQAPVIRMLRQFYQLYGQLK